MMPGAPQPTDLVRRAEAGEEVVLTRHGQAAVRLVPVARRALIRRVHEEAARKARPGEAAARSGDLIDVEDGLPA